MELVGIGNPKLIYCQKCHNPIGEVALEPGSAVRIKCLRCLHKTVVALEPRRPANGPQEQQVNA